jgi:hypothetical protein
MAKFVPEKQNPEEVIRVTTTQGSCGVEVCLNGVSVIRFENNSDGSHTILNMCKYPAHHLDDIKKLQRMGIPLDDNGVFYKLRIR